MIIPCSDMEWALQQRVSVLKLWGDCWTSDPYGSRWMRLETDLGKENFRKAKRDLIDSGLFEFECRIELSQNKQVYCWWVKNLHGCRTAYWKNAQVRSDLNNVDEDFHTEEQSEYEGAKNEVKDGIENTGGGVESTGGGVESTGSGAENTGGGTVNTGGGTVNTTQDSVNALIAGVSNVLKNVSETSHKHFNNSLNIEGRQSFINFCIEKIQLLKKANFEVRTWDAWIARHYEQYMNEWTAKQGKSMEDSERAILDKFNAWRFGLMEKEKRAQEERMRRRQEQQERELVQT